MLEDGTLEQGTKLEEQAPGSEEQARKVSEKEPEKQVSKGKGEVSESEGEVSGQKSKEDIAAEAKTVADVTAVEAYKKSPEYKTALQSEKDKSIHAETQPLRDKITELEKFNAEKEVTAKEAKERVDWEEKGIPESDINDFQSARRELGELARTAQADMDAKSALLKKAHAYELFEETGVAMKELMSCKTPEEMDKKAAELATTAKDKELESLRADKKTREESEAKKQKIDSGTLGAGVDSSGLSADEKLKQGFKDLKK